VFVSPSPGEGGGEVACSTDFAGVAECSAERPIHIPANSTIRNPNSALATGGRIGANDWTKSKPVCRAFALPERSIGLLVLILIGTAQFAYRFVLNRKRFYSGFTAKAMWVPHPMQKNSTKTDLAP
jgi:hypothetical protein